MAGRTPSSAREPFDGSVCFVGFDETLATLEGGERARSRSFVPMCNVLVEAIASTNPKRLLSSQLRLLTAAGVVVLESSVSWGGQEDLTHDS